MVVRKRKRERVIKSLLFTDSSCGEIKLGKRLAEENEKEPLQLDGMLAVHAEKAGASAGRAERDERFG